MLRIGSRLIRIRDPYDRHANGSGNGAGAGQDGCVADGRRDRRDSPAPASTGVVRDDPVSAADPEDRGSAHGGFVSRHHRALLGILGALLIGGFVYFVLPQIAGLGPTLDRLRRGDACGSGSGLGSRRFRSSARSSSSGASFRSAGGSARRSRSPEGSRRSCSRPRGRAASRSRRVSGPAPAGVTLVPAIFGTVVIVIALSMLVVDKPVGRHLHGRADRATGKRARWWGRAAALPQSLHDGLTAALGMVKRRDPSLLAVLAVLAYRTISYWLPTAPGAIEYFRLRHSVGGMRAPAASAAASPMHEIRFKSQSAALKETECH